MKLYSFSGSCALAAHISLLWTGEPFELQMLTRDELSNPEIRTFSPNGKVPILIDRDLVLTQNTAILNYIADRFPDANLAGSTPAQRAQTNLWLGFINSDIHPAYIPLFGATAYLENPQTIEHTKLHARKLVHKYLAQINAQLDGRHWLTGARSIADAYLFIVSLWAGMVGINLDGLDHLAAFIVRMKADPAVQQAMKDQGLV